MTSTESDPHHGVGILSGGSPLAHARAAMIMIHGRGASAEDILSLTHYLALDGVACLAPQAHGSSWYPQRFIVPVAHNEPWLSSALSLIDRLVAQCIQAGIPANHLMLLGFSQGACLALEYAARHPQRFGGVFALSGALIENGNAPRSYSGSLAQTPVFLGCSDVDFHIPRERVERSAALLREQDADVTLKLYAGMGHTINDDEINAINTIITRVTET